jgi:voltage-gated sodium channel
VLSLFRVVTLEDWTDIMYIQMHGRAGYGYEGMETLCTASQARPLLGALFFVSFVLFGTMIVLNLFIGIIMAGMDEARSEQAAEAQEPGANSRLDEELSQLGNELERIHGRIVEIHGRMSTLDPEHIPELPVSRNVTRRGGTTPRPGA